MEKRKKTEILINNAFTKIINEKDYYDVTIQDILDVSKVSRSAFYLHYKTKEDLLLSYSKHIFQHVFGHVHKEETHDFSNELFYDYRNLITHIFYHVRDEKDLFNGMLKSKANTLFLEEIRKNISHVVESYYNNYPYKDIAIPFELYKSILVESFISMLKYWMKNNYLESPEEMGKYYFSLFNRY